MTNIIFCCSCFNMGKKASEAYSTLFPNTPLPQIIRGRDRMGKYAKEIGNDHLTAISKLTGRFAYYIELDDDNKITKEYNLVTMKRIA